jgi:hypothetical protein
MTTSELLRGIKSQFFTGSAPSADDPRAESARLHAEIEQVRSELAETTKLISCLVQRIRSESLERDPV